MKNDSVTFCSYYQANLDRAESWYIVAILKSFEHVAFDRTIDPENSLFEFFVPPATEPYFIEIMNYFVQKKLVHNFQKLSNRLQNSGEQV